MRSHDNLVAKAIAIKLFEIDTSESRTIVVYDGRRCRSSGDFYLRKCEDCIVADGNSRCVPDKCLSWCCAIMLVVEVIVRCE